jgi:hypothetical protein
MFVRHELFWSQYAAVRVFGLHYTTQASHYTTQASHYTTQLSHHTMQLLHYTKVNAFVQVFWARDM